MFYIPTHGAPLCCTTLHRFVLSLVAFPFLECGVIGWTFSRSFGKKWICLQQCEAVPMQKLSHEELIDFRWVAYTLTYGTVPCCTALHCTALDYHLWCMTVILVNSTNKYKRPLPLLPEVRERDVRPNERSRNKRLGTFFLQFCQKRLDHDGLCCTTHPA